MTKAEVLDKVIDILKGVLSLDEKTEVKKNTTLEDDLKMDMLDQVEFSMGLEEEFGKPFDDEDVAECETVGAVADLVYMRMQED